MKVTMIIGEPCVGKSLLVKQLMLLGKPWEFANPKYVPYHHSRELGLTILGNYTDESHKFPGTDRMSMACQPHVVNWMLKAQNIGTKSVLFEGDRLGNYKMAKSLQYAVEDLHVIHLRVPQEFLAKRRAEERSTQDATFVRSRVTKIRNLVADLNRRGIPVLTRDHVNLSDTHDIIAWIRKHRL